MVKRNRMQLVGPAVDRPEAAFAHDGPCSEVWRAVGRRLQQRRQERGYSLERVARWAGISSQACHAYEQGAPIPALELTQIAELLGSPVSWFFEAAVQQEALPADQTDVAEASEPVGYQVATEEHRLQILADTFRQLDFEGQQHLLAISRALARSGGAGH